MKRHKHLVRVLKRHDPAAAERTLMRQWQLGRRALLAMIREKKAAVEAPPDMGKLRTVVGEGPPAS